MKELRIVLLCLCVANCISCHSKQMKQANQNTSQLNQEDISAVFNNRLIINSISPNHMDVTDSDYSINKLALFADNALENIHDGHWIKDTTDGRLVSDKRQATRHVAGQNSHRGHQGEDISKLLRFVFA
jgi:hypothetical protein